MRADAPSRRGQVSGGLAVSALLIGCMSNAPVIAGPDTSSASAASAPAASASAASLSAPAPARTACRFGAFVEETDLAGLNVRAAASRQAPVLGVLPATLVDEANGGFRVRVEVEVHGVSDGWFQVAGARDNEALTARPARPMFAGEGWVSGRKLTVKSQAVRGHARPDAGSPTWLKLGEGESFDNDAMVSAGQLVDCKGAWAQVEFAQDRLPDDVRRALVVTPAARAGLPAGRFRVWVNQLCALQETSCSGGEAR